MTAAHFLLKHVRKKEELEKMAESNKMKNMPVNKLMIQMGIPMILSMALQAVYNIVDSAFVGKMKAAKPIRNQLFLMNFILYFLLYDIMSGIVILVPISSCFFYRKRILFFGTKFFIDW